jgi:ribosomal protein S12 methylthiotransferase
MRQLDASGIRIVHDSNSLEAETVIINTCGFIRDAKQESIDTILQFIKAKERGDILKLFVMGCLSERYKKDLEKEIPEVDQYFGVNNIHDIVRALGYKYREDLVGERMLTTPSHYAYLKISEGCNRRCSFCAIPLMRGNYKSIPIQDLRAETEYLVNQGVKELMLIAQDLSYYGKDLYGKQKLSELLLQLADIDGLMWIRLHYAYPSDFPKEVLRVMKHHETICNYLDMPFQHISDSVLRKMRRGITKEQTYTLIDTLRNSVPGLTLRTSLMVGHPGESRKQFDELVELVTKVRFDRLGIFTYSEEEDTYGARNYKDSVPEEMKQERADILMNLQRSISYELNQKKIGNQLKVLIDRNEKALYIGRTEADSPEVDNEVVIRSEKLLPGEFYQAKITNASEYDLEAIV